MDGPPLHFRYNNDVTYQSYLRLMDSPELALQDNMFYWLCRHMTSKGVIKSAILDPPS